MRSGFDLIASGFHLPEINIFVWNNCEPNELDCPTAHAIRFQESWNLDLSFYQGLFSPYSYQKRGAFSIQGRRKRGPGGVKHESIGKVGKNVPC